MDLYLINEALGAAGQQADLNVLFPAPVAKGSALLSSGKEVSIPSGQDHYIFDDQQGEKKLWLFGRMQRGRVGNCQEMGEPPHSIRVVEKEWNEQGAIVRDFVLKKEDPLFEILERSRELDKKKR